MNNQCTRTAPWCTAYLTVSDDGLRGAFGSMLGSAMDLSSAAGSEASHTHSMAVSAARRQVFAKTAML